MKKLVLILILSCGILLQGCYTSQNVYRIQKTSEITATDTTLYTKATFEKSCSTGEFTQFNSDQTAEWLRNVAPQIKRDSIGTIQLPLVVKGDSNSVYDFEVIPATRPGEVRIITTERGYTKIPTGQKYDQYSFWGTTGIVAVISLILFGVSAASN